MSKIESTGQITPFMGVFTLDFAFWRLRFSYLSKIFTLCNRIPNHGQVVMARVPQPDGPGFDSLCIQVFFFLSYGNFSANQIGRGSTQSNIHVRPAVDRPAVVRPADDRHNSSTSHPPHPVSFVLVSLGLSPLHSAPWLSWWFSAGNDISPDSVVLKSLCVFVSSQLEIINPGL